MALALVRALLGSIFEPVSEAEAVQLACAEQKRLDLFDIQCQTCGGLGIVEDLANRWYQCPGMCSFHEPGQDPEEHCPRCEMVYGSKRCPDCDGLGSPRDA